MSCGTQLQASLQREAKTLQQIRTELQDYRSVGGATRLAGLSMWPAGILTAASSALATRTDAKQMPSPAVAPGPVAAPARVGSVVAGRGQAARDAKPIDAGVATGIAMPSNIRALSHDVLRRASEGRSRLLDCIYRGSRGGSTPTQVGAPG